MNPQNSFPEDIEPQESQIPFNSTTYANTMMITYYDNINAQKKIFTENSKGHKTLTFTLLTFHCKQLNSNNRIKAC
jgi:hypothetical protein